MTRKNKDREDLRKLRLNCNTAYKGRLGDKNLFHQSRLMKDVGELSKINFHIEEDRIISETHIPYERLRYRSLL